MNSILPKTVDNSYRGSKIVIIIFILITIITVCRSLVHIFFYDGGADSIAHIPLSMFGSYGSDTVVAVFALWGLSQLIMGIFYIIILLRYRTLIPLAYIGLIVEYAGRTIISIFKHLHVTQTPPGAYGDYVMVPLCIILLIFSLIEFKSK